MEKRIEALEGAVSRIESDLTEIRDVISSGFKKMDFNFESIVKEFKLIHCRIDQLNLKVNELKGDTHEGFIDVGCKLENLTGEIGKIGKVTNYSALFNNLKSIN